MSADTETPDGVSADLVFDILSNKRRRMVLYYLSQNGESSTIQEVAEQIAALENDVSVDGLTTQQRKRVYVSLYQTHIPKLEETGIVDEDDGKVRLTDRAYKIESYLTTGTESAYSWQKHYLALSTLGGVLLVLSVAGVPGAVAIPTWGLGLGLVLAFGLSASVQYWNWRQHRQGLPSELREHSH